MNSDAIQGSIVFIVDDEPTVLKAVTQTVESLGCKVTCFTSADECLSAMHGRNCDLLISDINMPGKDGLELLKEVRKDHPFLPVLLITGYGDVPIAVRAMKEGAYDFIEKPLDESTLIPKIQQAILSNRLKIEFDLTDAELMVLSHVASGKSNKEIAYMLDRSIRTVENHRHRLMKKLNVDTAAGLTKIAISMGLISIRDAS